MCTQFTHLKEYTQKIRAISLFFDCKDCEVGKVNHHLETWSELVQ